MTTRTQGQETVEAEETAQALEEGLRAAQDLDDELEQGSQEPQSDDEPTPGAMEAAFKVSLAMALSVPVAASLTRPAGYQSRRGWRNAAARKRALEEIRQRIELLHTAGMPVDMRVFAIETVALAVHFAMLRVAVLEGRPDATLAPLLRQMLSHRRALLLLLQAAVLTGGVSARYVRNILKGAGPVDFANDIIAALDLMQRHPELFRGNPLLPEEYVTRARELAHESLERLRIAGLPAEPSQVAEELQKAREERDVLYGLLLELDAESERLLVFFHGKAEAARRAPSLQHGRMLAARRPAKAKAPAQGEEAPATEEKKTA